MNWDPQRKWIINEHTPTSLQAASVTMPTTGKSWRQNPDTQHNAVLTIVWKPGIITHYNIESILSIKYFLPLQQEYPALIQVFHPPPHAFMHICYPNFPYLSSYHNLDLGLTIFQNEYPRDSPHTGHWHLSSSRSHQKSWSPARFRLCASFEFPSALAYLFNSKWLGPLLIVLLILESFVPFVVFRSYFGVSLR
jgi:hypothetical protein